VRFAFFSHHACGLFKGQEPVSVGLTVKFHSGGKPDQHLFHKALKTIFSI